VSHTDIASQQRRSDTLWQVQQSQQVGDVAARFVNDSADIFMAMAVAFDKLAVAIRFLDRVQILALDVFNQRDLGS
jgi:hypothetical protein